MRDRARESGTFLTPERRRDALLILTALALGSCGSPAAPSCTDQYGRGETQLNTLAVHCATVGTLLQCRATASIEGLYVYCPKSEDVTLSAAWMAGDAAVVRLVAPGSFEATGVGDSGVSASWRNLQSGLRPISVFPGTPPFPTFEVAGTVYRAGQTTFAGAIDGAVIEVLNGVVAGRSATSGVPPPLLPGYIGPFGGAGYYRLLGIPPGTYRLRATMPGYLTQERDITISDGAPAVDFPLQPS